MTHVLIPTKLEKTAAAMLEKAGYTVVQDDKTPLSEQVKTYPQTNVLIVRSEAVDAAVIDALPELKLVVRAGAGYNTIDTKYARSKNIDVMNTPGANSNAVAEEVIALILAAYRYVVPGDITTRAGKWEKKNYMGRELTGKTVAIVGLGAIGKLLARRLKGFDCTILAVAHHTTPEQAAEMGLTLCTIEEAFEQADIVSLHIPDRAENKKLINRALLSKLKDGALLVNCARAGIIDEDDLRAVKTEKKFQYLNDVYPKDEAGEKPIADCADIMLPHLGANTHEANSNAARQSAEQTLNYFAHGDVSCVVNK